MDTPLLVEASQMEDARKLCRLMLDQGVKVRAMFWEFDTDRARYYLCVAADIFEEDPTKLESYAKLNSFIKNSGVTIRLEDTRVLSGKMDSYTNNLIWAWLGFGKSVHIRDTYYDSHYVASAYLVYANAEWFGEKWG